ncbi:MAG TPA: M48 family metallopeptidase [Bacteroidales bacterium]|nr:M48 family metallopeptidase [Bacteroidales bacterium]
MLKQEFFTNIGLPLEEFLRNQIYNALQGETVEIIFKEAKVRKTENYWKYMLEGHSFKVDKNISKKLYTLFNSVKENLGYKEKLDFYISSDSSVNAFALSSTEDDEPNIININSSLLKLMNDDELRFIIGHEIGHLINKNANLNKLINFVFPTNSNLPGVLMNKIRLWEQLSELIADRYGFLANPSLPVCISAFFKMSSGMDAKVVDLDINAFMTENENRLEYFRKEKGLNIASHPINPIRIKAIDLFSKSDRFAGESGIGNWLTDADLDKQMTELTGVLLKVKNSELDYHISYFVAAAGIICSGIDGEFNDREAEIIMQALSDFSLFPANFFEEIIESKKVFETFNSSVKNILEINPAEKDNLLDFLINLVMADKKIKSDELKFIFEVGTGLLGFTRKEVAQIFASFIQRNYMPSIHDLG